MPPYIPQKGKDDYILIFIICQQEIIKMTRYFFDRIGDFLLKSVLWTGIMIRIEFWNKRRKTQ